MLLLEMSDAADTPDSCLGKWNLAFFLESLWMDDPELAEYANSTYGLPTRLTTFRSSSTGVDDLRDTVWEWDVGNGLNAVVHAVDLPGSFTQASTPGRMFWMNGKGVSYWDWEDEYRDDLVTVWQSYGKSPPPTLYGKSDLPDDFVAAIGLVADATVHAPIQRFEDFACKRRL